MDTSDSSSSSSATSDIEFEFELEDSRFETELVYTPPDQIKPYSNEPTKTTARLRTSKEYQPYSTKEKLVNQCKCGRCGDMATQREQICCHDHDINVRRQPHLCITEHPMFQEVIIHPLAQELAWLSYKDQYGRDAFISEDENQWRRHIAYRQCARWTWEKLGRSVRRVLPSCMVIKIRELYPSQENEYRHFQD